MGAPAFFSSEPFENRCCASRVTFCFGERPHRRIFPPDLLPLQSSTHLCLHIYRDIHIYMCVCAAVGTPYSCGAWTTRTLLGLFCRGGGLQTSACLPTGHMQGVCTDVPVPQTKADQEEELGKKAFVMAARGTGEAEEKKDKTVVMGREGSASSSSSSSFLPRRLSLFVSARADTYGKVRRSVS